MENPSTKKLPDSYIIQKYPDGCHNCVFRVTEGYGFEITLYCGYMESDIPTPTSNIDFSKEDWHDKCDKWYDWADDRESVNPLGKCNNYLKDE